MKIIRTSTVPVSLKTFCSGLLSELISEGYEVVAVSSPGPELNHVEKNDRVRCIAVPMERRMAPIKDLVSLIRLINVFRKEHPDMVHSITPKAGLLSMIAAKVCRVPVRVHTFTGLVFPTAEGFVKKILMFTDRLTCACATHIIPEGEGVKHDLQTYKITNKPLKVLGHGNIRGLDISFFDPTLSDIKEKASLIRVDGIFTFVYVGRLVKDKGINELIAAFERLNIKYPSTRLILVGNEEQDVDPLNADTIEKIRTNDSIQAVGVQDDVRPWLLAADSFVFPSYREGFPNVVIEAGAMGLPSIVTDINGSREIIREGKNGVIIPPCDPEALYEAMQSFILKPDLLTELSSNARQMIVSRYEQSFVRNCLKKYYREILSKR